MEKSAFSLLPLPSSQLPLPRGLAEVILWCFWIHSVHTSTHSLLDIVLNGVVYSTQGSAPQLFCGLVVFLMEIQSFLPKLPA